MSISQPCNDAVCNYVGVHYSNMLYVCTPSCIHVSWVDLAGLHAEPCGGSAWPLHYNHPPIIS